MKVLLKVLVISFAFLLLGACGVADGGKVTARDVLKNNEDADILMYNGFIYSNVTDLDWIQEDKDNFSKGEHLGDIKKTTSSSFGFRNFYATVLQEGTSIYSINEDEEGVGMILVEIDGEVLYYMQLLEG
ncbi:hypothetical protein ACFVAD_16900 [Sutcliffiella sp. NPDC057660]|uniref:hypothetical protein n=1 Tax=Sutcliffiella sp. NPDC057660 TaxID=3346199 RepID=UPI0036980435